MAYGIENEPAIMNRRATKNVHLEVLRVSWLSGSTVGPSATLPFSLTSRATYTAI
jgi:hypothetical protein